jgi:hypothetical protein
MYLWIDFCTCRVSGKLIGSIVSYFYMLKTYQNNHSFWSTEFNRMFFTKYLYMNSSWSTKYFSFLSRIYKRTDLWLQTVWKQAPIDKQTWSRALLAGLQTSRSTSRALLAGRRDRARGGTRLGESEGWHEQSVIVWGVAASCQCCGTLARALSHRSDQAWLG